MSLEKCPAKSNSDELPFALVAPVENFPQPGDRGYWGVPDNPDLIIVSQPATSVYYNPYGQVVIRQEGDYPDEDAFVRISPPFLRAVIDRLAEMLNEAHQ